MSLRGCGGGNEGSTSLKFSSQQSSPKITKLGSSFSEERRDLRAGIGQFVISLINDFHFLQVSEAIRFRHN